MNQSTYENPSCSNTSFPRIPKKAEQYYNHFLCSLCFSPALKGFHYIKQALWYEHQCCQSLPMVTKEIYEEISKLYCSQVSSVERCITFSIHRAYYANPQNFARMFPDCRKAPSNFRFLKTVSLFLNVPEE